MIPRHDITGLILAGGRGSRMGGVDKGLQNHAGATLAMHAMRRLAPQVGNVMINANRNLDVYAAMGAPVWTDSGQAVLADTSSPAASTEFAGPLAGFLSGLVHCPTQYMATVPCDSPFFPLDFVQRLALAICEHDADIAIAATFDHGTARVHPVFCLMKRISTDSLRQFMQSGQRKVETWASLLRRVDVLFDDAEAFTNVNTLDELHGLERHA